MINSQLQHIHIYCSNLDEMSAFWQHIAGATVIGPCVYAGEPGLTLELPGGLRLALQKKSVQPADTVHYTSGINHLGFTVENIEKALQHALQHDTVQLDKDVFEISFGRCAFIRGPENLRVELMQPRSA